VRSRKRTRRISSRTTKTLTISWWMTIWWKNLMMTSKVMVRPISICSNINSSRMRSQWLRKSWRNEKRNQPCSTTSRSRCLAHSSTTWWDKLRRLLVVRNTKLTSPAMVMCSALAQATCVLLAMEAPSRFNPRKFWNHWKKNAWYPSPAVKATL